MVRAGTEVDKISNTFETEYKDKPLDIMTHITPCHFSFPAKIKLNQ